MRSALVGSILLSSVILMIGAVGCTSETSSPDPVYYYSSSDGDSAEWAGETGLEEELPAVDGDKPVDPDGDTMGGDEPDGDDGVPADGDDWTPDGDVVSESDGDEPVEPDGDASVTDGDLDSVDESAEEIDPDSLPLFSFFVTSLAALRDLSGSQNGFGGDLTFGETGPGAGLKGADLICATIAERSLEHSSVKEWRAFLSATDDGYGNVVHAADRIGNGPWYDRRGRLLAPDLDSLLNARPEGGDSTIRDDFPNEDGIPNHQPDPTKPEVDNHDMLTGSSDQGRLYSQTATCQDWTSSAGTSADGKPRVGHSWPRSGGPGGRPGPGDQDMENWMSALNEAGCAPGVNLVETGGPNPMSNTVGSGGGYGGFYCFALHP